MAATDNKASTGRRKTVDKWKKKKWFSVVASKVFDSRPLGETPAEKPINLIGRTMKVTLDTVTGQRAKRDIIVFFKYADVQGQTINTKISKFQLNKGTYSRLVRRRNSKVDFIGKIRVVGGEARLTIVAITETKATKKQKAGIRKLISKEISILNGKQFEEVVRETLLGSFSSDLQKKVSKICYIKRVVVAKAIFTEAK